MAPPARSRRWIVLAILLLLLAAGVGWTQTQDAFQRLWLPLAARALGGEWSAEAGRIGFGGSLEIDGLRFDLPQLATGDIAHLRVRLRPWASLRRGAAVVERLELRGANLEVHERETSEGQVADAPSAGREPSSLGWPEIEQARIDDLRVRMQAGAFALAIGPLAFRADDLLVPERGTLSFEVPIERVAPDDALRGRLTGSLAFGAGEPDGEGNPFEAMLELAIEPQGRSPMVLALRGSGRSAGGGETARLDELEASWTEKETRLLELRGSGTLLPDPRLEVHLTLGEAGRVASLLGAPSLAARVEGDLRFEGSYDELVIVPDVLVDELRVYADAVSTLSEPIQLGGRIIWQRLERTLSLAPLELGGRAAEGLGRLLLEGEVQPGQAADLTLVAKAFDLLPWLRLALGGEGVPEVRAPIDGSLRVRQTDEETSIEGDLQLSVIPDSESGSGPLLRLGLLTTLTAGSQVEGSLTLDGPGVEGQAGRARIAWERERTAEQMQTRLRADIAALDLTHLAPLWEGVSGAEVERVSESAASAETSADLVDLDVSIGALQLRGLAVRGGRLRAQIGAGSWEVRVDELGLADGLVELEAYGGPHAGGERIGWDLAVDDVDVSELLAAASSDGESPLSGRLSVASRAEGVAAPGEDLLTAPDGRVSFELTEGRASGLGVQRLLTEVVEIAQFAVIDYDEVEGDYAIENGRVLIDELRLDGVAVHLVATGEVGARDVDLVINPRLGPSLRAMVPGDMLGRIVGTANQLLALPIVVVVRGPLPGFEIEIQPAAPSVLQGSFSGLGELLMPEAPEPAAAPPPPGS